MTSKIRTSADTEDVKGSFRDPSGSLFLKDGTLYRRISSDYRVHWEQAENSGLLGTLIRERLLIPHEVLEDASDIDATAYKIIRPTEIPFISYPYEWCFSQLKDAALLTLAVQKRALEHGMILKDASAFNVQFLDDAPVFIDTLSFEKYEEGLPWVGYRQFCQHFLAPLALMSRTDMRLNSLFQIYLDGIPLDLASHLLPRRTFFSPHILFHIHVHAKSQKRFAATRSVSKYRISRHNLLALMAGLESAVRAMKLTESHTEWGNYYEETNYSKDSFQDKSRIVTEFLDIARPTTLWDMGANTGEFSRLASKRGIHTVAFDNDPIAVEKNYVRMRRAGEKHLLPLLVDFSNPSPALGWEHAERMSLEERGPADALMALAVVHHLAISNNVPLPRIAEYFSRSCRDLIVEFVPKSDTQVQKLLSTRKDVFPNYTEEGFEKAFDLFFSIRSKRNIVGSQRVLYHMVKR